MARSGLYFAESLPLTILASLITGKNREEIADKEKLKGLWQEIKQLHDEDIKNIERGLYPKEVLKPTGPSNHIATLAKLWWDAAQVAWRMRKRKTKEFSKRAEDLLEDLPDYYRRNFHFQTDGYLSEASAELYDHQVDILFSGAAGAMRRLVIPPLQRHLKSVERGQILELGCGPGSSTSYLAMAFPNVKITAIDLSSPYIKTAQRKLKNYPKVDALQADATDLPFKEKSFDAVVSVYLLHELPEEVRIKVISEARRVLKPGGLLVLADSIQYNDDPRFNWALDRFPLNYHEPFYANYVRTPLKSMLESCGFTKSTETHRFLTKVIWSERSSDFKRSKAVSISP